GPALIWEPLNDLGRLRLKGNDLEGAKRLFELAREVIQASGDARGEVAVMGNMSALAVAQNDLDAAQQALRRAIKVARSSGQIKPLAKLKHNHGLLLLRQHQPELAEEAFIESDALSQELDWREGLALNSAQLRRLRAAKAHEP
ncbi:tetratricopeptide repeat protein, partial [Brevundimonas sp.]|uniref:tetratricopeptide repeat protein n=1 Tax=Brevundimonas sp. TaxID=1871086 RepID=UPI001994BE3A